MDMNTSYSQLTYRSVFAVHCKTSKNLSRNVSSKIELFEKLKNKTDPIRPKQIDDPKPFKLTNNLDLLKAFSLFNHQSLNLNTSEDYLMNSSIDSSLSQQKNMVYCSTPRDTQLSTHNNNLSNLLLKPVSIQSSTTSSDAGLGGDENLSFNTNTTINKSLIFEATKNVKKTALKLNQQRLNLLENDKLIRKRYDKLKSKLVFKERKNDDEKKFINDYKIIIIDNHTKKFSTINIEIFNKKKPNLYIYINNLLHETSRNKMKTNDVGNRNNSDSSSSINNRRYQNHIKFDMRNDNGKVKEKIVKNYDFPVLEFIFDEKLFRNNNDENDNNNNMKKREQQVVRKTIESVSPVSPVSTLSTTSSSSAVINTPTSSRSSIYSFNNDEISTVNLHTNENDEKMKIFKINSSIGNNRSQPNAEDKERSFVNKGDRRSKVGEENEKELNRIFQQIYNRHINNLSSSPSSSSSSSPTELISFKRKNPLNKVNKNEQLKIVNSLVIETYRKNGRLISNC